MVEYPRTQDREPTEAPKPRICVAGIGGGGLNVLDRICLDRLMEATLVSLHTDVRVLGHSMAPVKIQLGAEMMRGIGCGGDPELGREAAKASRDAIREAIQGHEMIFLCTGLGGGTGSGAAPIVAEIARETGALVFVFATVPFSFEGRRRLTQAEVALDELRQSADALILFENNRMGELILPKEGIQKAFSQADQLIGHSVRAIATMVGQPGIVRIGLSDLTSALRSPDARCLFGFGEARGNNRVSDALKRALKSPLVNQGLLLQNARNLLVHVAGGESLTLAEVDALMKQLGRHVPEDTQIMFGLAVDPKLTDMLSVTLLSSLSAQDMALESAGRAAASDRISTRPADPAKPLARRVEAPVVSNGSHAPAAPAPAPITPISPIAPTGPVTPAFDLFDAPAVNAPAPAPVQAPPPVEPPDAPPSAVAPVTPPTLLVESSYFVAEAPLTRQAIHVHTHEAAPEPVKAPEPIAEKPVVQPPPIPEPVMVEAPAPVLEPEPAPAPVAIAEPPTPPPVARPTRHHHASVTDNDSPAIIKTSIFSVIEDEEEEEAEASSHWADKYIQPKAQQPAPPVVEPRRDPVRAPEPALAAAAPPQAKAPAAPEPRQQPSLNLLQQDEVGRFKGTDKTIVEGEDLDVPTWMRLRGKVKR